MKILKILFPWCQNGITDNNNNINNNVCNDLKNMK